MFIYITTDFIIKHCYMKVVLLHVAIQVYNFIIWPCPGKLINLATLYDYSPRRGATNSREGESREIDVKLPLPER